VDLQGFLVGRHFVVKEFAVLREGHVLSHFIFGCPYSSFKIRKILRSLVDCEASWIAMGGWDNPVQHGETVDYNDRNWYRR